MSEWDDDEPKTIEDAARFEQYALWGDLAVAVQTGVNTDWSMQCEGLADRIVTLARFVGAVPWEYIQIPLLRSGVYQRVFDEAGLEYPAIDWERVAWVEARIKEGTSRALG